MTLPWVEVTQERYTEMLEILPPAIMTGLGFLVGEPADHRRCTITNGVRPRYAAFVQYDGRFLECGIPLTTPEFKAVTALDIAKLLEAHDAA